MSESDSADDEWIAGLIKWSREQAAIAPKSKLDLSYKEVEHVIVGALRNAYHGGEPGWHMEPDDYQMPPFGDLDHPLTGKGKFQLEHPKRLLKLGDAIDEGISRLIASNDPQASDKIRRLTQIAITAGYLFALIDDKAADKRKPKRGNAKKSENRNARAEKVKQYSIANPDATQKQMAKEFDCDPKTIGRYLNN